MRNVIIPSVAAAAAVILVIAHETYLAGYREGLRNCPAPARTTIIMPKGRTEEVMCVRTVRKAT